MTVALVPELRQPPHDPLTLLLGGRLGWPIADDSALASREFLELPRFPGSLPLLTEPTGSLGGLRPPSNVAVSDTGDIWLLDQDSGRLMRFDPCECAFVDMPCFGREGDQPGQLRSPVGIATAAGHVFVCDTGNRRVQVVLTPQLVVSAVWRAPFEWQPTGAVVDDRFRVHVVDPQNGMVHHFGWSGRYLGNTGGVGASRHIALASDGSLLVAGELEAYRVSADGVVTSVEPQADDLTATMPPLAFEVAADGTMHLGPLCEPPNDWWFDARGEHVPPPEPPTQIYERKATVHLGPLDSLIDDCVWHRVTLLGEIPTGCGVNVDTFTAQVPLGPAEIQGLPETAWETRLTCTSLADVGWDGLVRSTAGRYLWIRLGLFGGGLRTPRVDEAVVEFPRISLRRFLPAVYGAEPTSADFTDRLLAIVDRSLRDTEVRIDELPALLDPHSTAHLDWLASWVGIRPDHRLPEHVRRDIVAGSSHLLDLRGTVAGLHQLLIIVLGLEDAAPEPTEDASGCRCGMCPPPRQTCPPRPPQPSCWRPPPLILEHFRLRRWFEAGSATLGDRAVLWGQSIVNRSQLGESAQVGVTALKGTQDPARDSFHVYAHKFSVFVPAAWASTAERRRSVEQLVAWASPAHTQAQVEYVEPRLRIGVQASIGLNTVVARLPRGVTLGQTELGPASVLDGDDRRTIDRSAVGTTAILG
jgi:phage tail-like protein